MKFADRFVEWMQENPKKVGASLWLPPAAALTTALSGVALGPEGLNAVLEVVNSVGLSTQAIDHIIVGAFLSPVATIGAYGSVVALGSETNPTPRQEVVNDRE